MNSSRTESLTEWLDSKEQRLQILLIVCHPDDDAVFAGELQRRLGHHHWQVVCLTYSAASERGREMLCWQHTVGVRSENLAFLGAKDDPEDFRQGRCSIDDDVVNAQLRGLRRSPDLVVTHNEFGEYGHPHHIMLHRVVRQVYPDRRTLVFGEGLDRVDLSLPVGDKWERATQAYVSQRSVIDKFRRAEESFTWLPAGPAVPE